MFLSDSSLKTCFQIHLQIKKEKENEKNIKEAKTNRKIKITNKTVRKGSKVKILIENRKVGNKKNVKRVIIN